MAEKPLILDGLIADAKRVVGRPRDMDFLKNPGKPPLTPEELQRLMHAIRQEYRSRGLPPTPPKPGEGHEDGQQ